MRTAIIVAAMLSDVAGSPSSADGVSAFHCKTAQRTVSANLTDVYASYGSRSVDIIERALVGDTARLQDLVAPNATFTVFQGDVGIGPRSTGPVAAVDFAKQVAPTGYRYSAGSAGPFSMDPCSELSTELTLVRSKADEAVLATFKYRDSVLISVQASQINLVHGDFPKHSAQ